MTQVGGHYVDDGQVVSPNSSKFNKFSGTLAPRSNKLSVTTSDWRLMTNEI